MASSHWHRIETIFFEALDLTPAERSVHFDRACGDDDGLRAEIEAMLDAHEGNQELGIEKKLLAADETDSHQLVGQRLGPWRLTAPLGRGGTAEVYVAERADGHFRQRVAIKVVQPGWAPVELAERLRLEREKASVERGLPVADEFESERGREEVVLPKLGLCLLVQLAQFVRESAVLQESDALGRRQLLHCGQAVKLVGKFERVEARPSGSSEDPRQGRFVQALVHLGEAVLRIAQAPNVIHAGTRREQGGQQDGPQHARAEQSVFCQEKNQEQNG